MQDAVALLKGDHRKVEALFEQYEGADSATEKTGVAKEICKLALQIHINFPISECGLYEISS